MKFQASPSSRICHVCIQTVYLPAGTSFKVGLLRFAVIFLYPLCLIRDVQEVRGTAKYQVLPRYYATNVFKEMMAEPKHNLQEFMFVGDPPTETFLLSAFDSEK